MVRRPTDDEIIEWGERKPRRGGLDRLPPWQRGIVYVVAAPTLVGLLAVTVLAIPAVIVAGVFLAFAPTEKDDPANAWDADRA